MQSCAVWSACWPLEFAWPAKQTGILKGPAGYLAWETLPDTSALQFVRCPSGCGHTPIVDGQTLPGCLRSPWWTPGWLSLQVKKCADAGADIVRITVQSKREAEACYKIREQLFKDRWGSCGVVFTRWLV